MGDPARTRAGGVGSKRIAQWWSKRRYRVALPLVAVVLTTTPLVVETPPVGIVEGDPASRTLRANRTVQFVDEAATQRAREEAARAVQPVHVFDPGVLAQARAELTAYFDAVRGLRREMAADATPSITAVPPVLRQYERAWTESFTALDEATFESASSAAEQLTMTVLSQRFTFQELQLAREQLAESARVLPFSEHVRDAIAGVAHASVRPTLVFDRAATDAARNQSADAVDPVVIVKQRGENIVQRGEVVTDEHLEIVRRLGILDQGGSVPSLVALFTLATLAIATSAAYLWRFERTVFERARDLLLVTVLTAGAIWVTRGILWLFPDISLYLLPVPLSSVLATLLVNNRVGLLTAVLSTIGGVLLGFSEGASAVSMLVWSTSAVVAVSFMTERRRVFYVGVFLVLSGAAVGALATLAAGVSGYEALSAAGDGALGGLFAAVLAYGLLPFFEHVFGVTTDVRLLELGSPGHPVMRRLMVEAPGTYNHSVLTGTLAESAAEEIGARGLLARVGAYYHDIGKLESPAFFVENQSGDVNPHDVTEPSRSASIIRAHVDAGVALARRSRLPEEVVEIVAQHHGDSLIAYFYDRAAAADGAVHEDDFRYASARPRSREAALVMLADAVEAAVRALKDPSPDRIESVVRAVVNEKTADGQLNESDLTLADIERAIRVYTALLAAMYHPRVEYPVNGPRR